ncbi:MAG: hypothetical protein AB7H97_18270 [Pseudobdellovibrionaceae bacterium]
MGRIFIGLVTLLTATSTAYAGAAVGTTPLLAEKDQLRVARVCENWNEVDNQDQFHICANMLMALYDADGSRTLNRAEAVAILRDMSLLNFKKAIRNQKMTWIWLHALQGNRVRQLDPRMHFSWFTFQVKDSMQIEADVETLRLSLKQLVPLLSDREALRWLSLKTGP